MSLDSTSRNLLPEPEPPPASPAPLWTRLLRRPWPPVDVLLLKTNTCPLCDEALELLRRRRRRLGLGLRVLDISSRPDLLAEFGLEVPVVFVAGRKRFFGSVDPALLAREVAAARDRSP